MTEWVEVLGTIGGASIALSLVPQVIKTYHTKSAGDISHIYQWVRIGIETEFIDIACVQNMKSNSL